MASIQCINYSIHVNEWSKFSDFIIDQNPSKIFILVDNNTEKYCLHTLLEKLEFPSEIIKIPSGEQNKTIATCQIVWDQLLKNGADRQSLLINLGGGVIGDLGGFCGATHLRGIRFIQMPTTLLSQVDASVGGKLGVDLNGFKNMIGVFKDPEAVFIFTDFLKTLTEDQYRSGYAELLKHGLIKDKLVWQKLSNNGAPYLSNPEEEILHSVKIKKNITEEDPLEKGLRKILNFGHTVGHAVETYWLDSESPMLHGEAIAIGMVCEAFLSYRTGHLTEIELFEIRESLLKIYGHHPHRLKPADDYISLMAKDKKNIGGKLKFSLLNSIGDACFDIEIEPGLVRESLIFYKEKI